MEKNIDEADTNPFRYCGEYWDSETETYYLRARYYDPALGRFTSEDTHWNVSNMIYGDNPQKINEREDKLGLKSYSYAPSISAITQSCNLYVYCGNNPVMCVDSNGEILEWVALGGLLIASLVGLTGCSSKDSVVDEPGDKYRRYDVPLYNQGSYNLCWAFCQVMVESYVSGETLSQDDATKKAIKLAQDTRGSTDKKDWNKEGMPQNTYKQFAPPKTIEELFDHLENGPVYATYGINVEEHIVVVAGVNVTKGVVYTNNPWGISGSQTFDDFLNGFLCKPLQPNGGMKLMRIYTINY